MNLMFHLTHLAAHVQNTLEEEKARAHFLFLNNNCFIEVAHASEPFFNRRAIFLHTMLYGVFRVLKCLQNIAALFLDDTLIFFLRPFHARIVFARRRLNGTPIQQQESFLFSVTDSVCLTLNLKIDERPVAALNHRRDRSPKPRGFHCRI